MKTRSINFNAIVIAFIASASLNGSMLLGFDNMSINTATEATQWVASTAPTLQLERVVVVAPRSV